MPVVGDIGAMSIDEEAVSDDTIIGDDGRDDEAPVVAPEQPCVATSASSSSGGSAPSPPAVAAAAVVAQRILGTTCYWRGFKFTEIRNAMHDAIGWECQSTSGSRKRKAICDSNASRRQPRSETLAICNVADPTDDLEGSVSKLDVNDDPALSESSSSAPDDNGLDVSGLKAIADALFGELSSGDEQPVVDIDQGSAPASSSSVAVILSPEPIEPPVRVQRITGSTDYWRSFKFTEVRSNMYSRVAIRGRAFFPRVPVWPLR